MDSEHYNEYLAKIHSAQSELEKQAKSIISQAEQERRKINLYLAERENEYNKEYYKKLFELEEKDKKLNNLKEAIEKIIEEHQIGFPYMADKMIDATKIICNNSYQRKEEYRYRDALKEIEILKGLIAFHEYLYPHLTDLHVKTDYIPSTSNLTYTEEEKLDESHDWLTPEEYRNKPTAERNQLALERYKKKHLSNWEIGKLYENYIGFTYEQKGYKVNYNGIKERIEDKGRDLICENDEEILLIQCKNWSSSKTIFEKHIFQFYGSIKHYEFEYNKKSKLNLFNKKVKGIFYTTTHLSDFARYATKSLGIELVENDNMDKDYPCIKCNIGRDGYKIYHLPFDQQYDTTKISPERGEFYAQTCIEAESKGFRRAFKWHKS
jgi:hypothetical protein